MDYVFKTDPFSHQREVFNTSHEERAFAVFWEQGTGKTKLIIDTACALYEAGKIDCLIVVAPGGVDLNWLTDEIPTHMPERVLERTLMHKYQTVKAATKWHKNALATLLHHSGLIVFAVSYEGYMTKEAKNFVWKLLQKRRVLYTLDESHNIKTPSAKRTISLVASGKYASYRRIMSGTPVSLGPFDIYKQMQFLDEDFWKRHGFQTLAEYKEYFAEFDEQLIWVPGRNGGKPQQQPIRIVKNYRNLDELYAILAKSSSRVTKEDVLDLPPKLYSRRYFELSNQQTRAYTELRDQFMTEIADGPEDTPCLACKGSGVEFLDMGNGNVGEQACYMCGGYGFKSSLVEAPLAIVRLLRLQQITCGYVPTGDDETLTPIGNHNPRLDALEEVVGPLGHASIVWARFRHDIDLIMDRLASCGRRPVRYDGTMTDAERERSKEMFNHGDATDFVGNPAKGREGLTLIKAKTVVYYNNSFKLIDRLQSEDRPHRIGQDEAVNYVDLCAVLDNGGKTVDTGILDALRNHFDIASQITGGKLRSWM